MATIDIERFNRLGTDEVRAGLLRCCECEEWADAVLAHRPFGDAEKLLRVAREEWFALAPETLVAAFNRKPRIGDLAELRKKFGGPGWDANEQAGVAGADDETLRGLIDDNTTYFNLFGFIFVIFATGKSAAEMLSALRIRLTNDRRTEIANAAAENHRITELRFYKWLGEEAAV